MEKVKSDKMRCLYFYTLIFLIIELLFLIANKPLKSTDLFFAIGMIFPLLGVIAYYEFNKRKGVFFSKEYMVIMRNKNEKIELEWNDITVDSNSFRYWPIGLTVCILNSKNNSNINEPFELNWFTEKSALARVKEYVPSEHELYKVVARYAVKRKIEF